MKKLIAILAVMIVLVGAVFAATNDKLTLSSSVAKVTPNFQIVSGAKVGNATGTGDAAIDTLLDISEADIAWNFTLRQKGNVRVTDNQTLDYSKFRGIATLTVTINPFSGTVNSATATQSTAYEIQAEGTAKGAGIENKLSTENPTIANDKHSVEFVLTYLGKKIADTDATNVGTIAVKWTHDDTLPMEGNGSTYTTDVVLTYSVQ